MKILLICATSDSVCTFRMGLINALQKEGHKVSVIAFDDKRKVDIEMLGVDFYHISDENRSINPFRILSLKNRYYKIINQIVPDMVFTFMLKPNIFGVLAAKKAKIKNIYSMVEGVGDVFINSGLKWSFIRKIVCRLYKKAFKNAKKVIFLNNDDKNEFIARKIVNKTRCEVIPGIGVDINKFTFKPLKNHNKFLMVARMLKTKGVYEFCNCARIVREKYPEARFYYLGAEGTVTLENIKEYIEDGSINYLGTTKDVRPYYEDCTACILPSYREGMPMAIMEAQSTGRAIITTNANSCKDTVVDGYNGFVVPCRDYVKMAEKIIWSIENPLEFEGMGKNARKFVEGKFDQNKINKRVVDIILNNGQ